jgi:hypothetical protein
MKTRVCVRVFFFFFLNFFAETFFSSYFEQGAEAPATLGRCVQYQGHLREGPMNWIVLDMVQK